MANHDKGRVPDETRSSMPGTSQAGAPGGVLYVRLWSAAAKRLDCRPSRSNAPLPGLVLDVIRASGGGLGAENADFLSAEFPDLFSALQCSRRVQWALEGLSENETSRGAGAAILVDSGDESRRFSGPSVQDWEGAEPGKILLRPGVSQSVEGVPGITLGAATAAGCREWAWKSLPGNASFAADEQVVLGMLRSAGRSDPGSQAPMPPAADRGTATQVFTNAGAVSPGRVAEGYLGDAPPSGVSRFLRIPIVLGAVGALLVVVAVVFFLTRKAPVQSAAPSTPPPATVSAPSVAPPAAPPLASAPAPSAHPTPTPTPSKRTKLTDLLKKGATSDQKTNPTPPPLVSHCDLTEEGIQRSLARADRYMHDGDLSDARASYQHVLGCPSARERAQEGLNRIQRMAAQSGSPN